MPWLQGVVWLMPMQRAPVVRLPLIHGPLIYGWVISRARRERLRVGPAVTAVVGFGVHAR